MINVSIADFFKPIRLKSDHSQEEYEELSSIIETAQAFANSIYQGVYIIDYFRRSFLYVSDNPIFLCGKPPEVVQKMGYYFYLKNVPEDDLQMLMEINFAGFAFYNNIPVNMRRNYIISYNFRLIQSNNEQLMIDHKLTPLKLDKDGNMWLALCLVSTSSNHTPGHVLIQNTKDGTCYEYNFDNKEWLPLPKVKFTKTEKLVLLLTNQGYTMDDIAEKTGTTLYAIRFHRVNILRKLKVKNISEAIIYALNHKLI